MTHERIRPQPKWCAVCGREWKRSIATWCPVCEKLRRGLVDLRRGRKPLIEKMIDWPPPDWFGPTDENIRLEKMILEGL